jgi:hypothetical protein
MGRFFSKAGNWPYYVATNGKDYGTPHESKIDADADVAAKGAGYYAKGILTRDAQRLSGTLAA